MLFKFTDKRITDIKPKSRNSKINCEFIMLLLQRFSKRIIEIFLTIKMVLQQTNGENPTDGDACVRNWMWFLRSVKDF